ncbi:hypothetical protein MRB56_09100 [Halomonas cupida]|uniref:hypothetical protein n=1 Tax=Halomonas cupida TaxID=44933 RepID=UPI0039B3DC59
MKVKALKRGTYPNHREREIGDVFDYEGPTRITRGGKEVDYFPSWMEPLEAREPVKDDSVAPSQNTGGDIDAPSKDVDAGPLDKPSEPEPDKGDDLAELRQKYELVVGEKPHHMKKAETLRKDIDEAIKAKSE